MCACSEKEAGGGKTRSSWSTESMLVVGVDTRPLMLACKVDLQVFLSVPVYHNPLPISNPDLSGLLICPFGLIALR